jgi:CRP/FNR family transcriptional regulator, anaerobic regulatory protein
LPEPKISAMPATGFDPLFIHIRKYIALDDEQAAELAGQLRYRKVKKKEWLLSEQQVCSVNYFVLRGCLRMYFIREDGVEQIIQFAIENWWLTDYQRFDWQQPSRFYIQAVEVSELILLDRDSLPSLCDRLPLLDRYFRLVTQRAFAAAQQNLYYIYSSTGEERYRRFATTFPEFVQRIPQYMVASYLGFTPEFVSKIRRKRQ